MAQNVWQAQYKILLIILLNEFIKNMKMMIKNGKGVELNIKI